MAAGEPTSERARSIPLRARRDPLALPAAASALVAIALILGAALVATMIRLLPWLLDPTIGVATLTPFAKSLFAVALEAALLTGWPVGWALATQRLVDRGEARVLASLGEPPRRTVARLLPQAAVFGAALVLSSVMLGRDAAAPGRIVNALLEEGRSSCAPGTTHAVPFVSATWLCPNAPPSAGALPRLVGRTPVGGALFTAREAEVSDDLRRIELADARLVFPSGASKARVHVGTLVLRGLAPWARASSLPPALRAAVVGGSAIVAACAAAAVILGARRRRVGGVAAAAIGAAGPLAALATLRALELRVPERAPGGWLLLFALVPVAALLAVFAGSALVAALPEPRRAGSK